MSVQLQIDDGSPYWWDSQAIWVVPGADPLGAPAVPAVGDMAYLWATVRNLGTSDAEQAKVEFWVANPSLQLRKSVARFIGAAFVDVAAGDAQDVLCLTPWSVELVNGGHECVLAEVSSPYDPLSPPPSDPDVFDPPAYRQLAQRNLNVLTLSPQMMKVLVLGVHAGERSGRAIHVAVEIGGELDRRALHRLGLGALRPAGGRGVAAGLSLEGGCGSAVPERHRLAIEVPPGRSVPVHLHLAAREPLAHGEYALVRVIEHDRDKPAGGITFVVTAPLAAATAAKGR